MLTDVLRHIDVYAPGEDIPLPSTQDIFRGVTKRCLVLEV